MMRKANNIHQVISLRTAYKRKFSIREMYFAIVKIPGAISWMVRNNKSKLVNENFIERLQLAVTEVNGCAACSYAHTMMALRRGMSGEEISSFLKGDDAFIKPEEAKAIMFAQHYADSRAYPEKDAYVALVKEYGKNKAAIILSAIQVIFVGNVYGIPFSALQSRLKGKPYKDSTVLYEVGMLIAGFICIPFALLHGILKLLIIN